MGIVGISIAGMAYVIEEVEKKSDGKIIYQGNDITNARVNGDAKKRTVKEFLDDCNDYTAEVHHAFEIKAPDEEIAKAFAKNKAREDSDVDLMIVSEIEGIEYYQLVNELESALGKKVDLIRLEAAIQNVKLMNEILKDGVKIYG